MTRLAHELVQFGGSPGFRNRLRNGSFLSWPLGFSGSIAAAATGVGCIAASGWAVLATGAAVAFSQVAVQQSSCISALQLTGATSVTGLVLGQRLESFDAMGLVGQNVTFQLTVFNNTGGTITPQIATRYPTAQDNWASATADLAAVAMQACPNGVWTTISYSFVVSSSANAYNGYEVKIDFGNNFGSGAQSIQVTAGDFSITADLGTGVNGSPPTLELHHQATDVLRCKRYLQCSYANGVAPGTATQVGITGGPPINTSTTAENHKMQFIEEMWAAPTFQFYDAAGTLNKLSHVATGVGLTFTNGDPITSINVNSVDARGFSLGYFSGAPTTGSYFCHYVAYADFW